MAEGYPSKFELKGKVAVVTGAGSGIGAAIARTFASAHAHCIILDREPDKAESTVEEIAKASGSASCMQVDVADPFQSAECIQKLLEQYGTVDILVNNAGIGHVGTIEQTHAEDLDRLYSVNVRGVFNMTKPVVPAMLKQRSGSIINIASIGGVVGIKDRLAYCTTKFAVVGFTKALALDHAQQGIRANAICPGRVQTPFVEQRLKEYPDPEKAYRDMCSTQPMGRMATPEEIAMAALYLAGSASSFVTGSCLMVDGGWNAG